jgi:hypothetical protein
MSDGKEATMKRTALHKITILAAAIALGSASMATEALARGGGGGFGGGHFGGGGFGGAHFGAGGLGGGHFGGFGGGRLGGLGGARFGGGFGHFGAGHFGGPRVGGFHRGFHGRRFVGVPFFFGGGYGDYAYPFSYDDYAGGTYAYPYESYYGNYASSSACWQRHRVRVHGKLQWRRHWVCG